MKVRLILCAALAASMAAMAACAGPAAPEATVTPAATAAETTTPTAAPTQTPQPTQAAATPDASAADAALIAAARDALDAFLAGDFKKLDGLSTAEVKAAVTTQGGWETFAQQLSAQVGKMISVGEATTMEAQGQKYAIIPVVYETMTLNATMAFDAQGRMATFLFQPAQAEAPAAVAPEGVAEEEVTVDAKTGYPLGGTISLPAKAEGKLPAVLLVWGSGAGNRDEVIGANRVFAQVAHGLAKRGYLVLRFDKRTGVYPEVQAKPEYTVKDEYIEDVLAAMALLKADPRVDASRVFLLGHSQGGMLAPRLQEAGADAAGLILMAGTPRLLSDLLYDQEMDMAGTMQKQAASDADKKAVEKQKDIYKSWKAEVEALYKMTETEAKAHEALFDGVFPAYYLYEMAKSAQPIDLLQKNETPVLVLQGENDKQVYADPDFRMYKDALEGKPYASFKLYPGLSHCFMPSKAEDLLASMQEYNEPMEIPAEVLDDMDAFMKAVK